MQYIIDVNILFFSSYFYYWKGLDADLSFGKQVEARGKQYFVVVSNILLISSLDIIWKLTTDADTGLYLIAAIVIKNRK